MKRFMVINLATGEEFEYLNNIGAVENLINTYLMQVYGAMSLYNEKLRAKTTRAVTTAKRSYCIGDFSILKGK